MVFINAIQGDYNFQLHTVHQELISQQPLVPQIKNFQLHTVHQEQGLRNTTVSSQKPFNSTRCIRNISLKTCLRASSSLSTPHGALGTIQSQQNLLFDFAFQLHTVHQEQATTEAGTSTSKTFNSTRCIRNMRETNGLAGIQKSFNSTRCIRNFRMDRQSVGRLDLSTPHGALGTEWNTPE